MTALSPVTFRRVLEGGASFHIGRGESKDSELLGASSSSLHVSSRWKT